jgi:hypothetical protein
MILRSQQQNCSVNHFDFQAQKSNPLRGAKFSSGVIFSQTSERCDNREDKDEERLYNDPTIRLTKHLISIS